MCDGDIYKPDIKLKKKKCIYITVDGLKKKKIRLTKCDLIFRNDTLAQNISIQFPRRVLLNGPGILLG